MSDFGAISLSALGSITAPTSVVLATPAAVSMPTGYDGTRWGEYQAIPLPSANAVIFCHGVEAMRYSREGVSHRIGLLAPDSGMTADSTGVKRNSTLTMTGDMANNDEFTLGLNSPPLNTVYAKTTLDLTLARAQIRRGVSQDDTISNLQKMIEGTGTNGLEYYDGYNVSLNGFYDPDFWHTTMLVEAPIANLNLTANTLKVQSVTSGTSGYTLSSSEVVDGGGTYSWSSATLSNGAIGTGSAPSAGDYEYAVAALRSGDTALSAANSTRVSVNQDGSYNVSLAAAPSFVTRDATDYNRWLRTQVGAVQLFKVKDTTATSATDDVSDDTLANKLFRFQYRDELKRPRISGYPVVHSYGVMWRGKLWLVGAKKWASYTKGTVSVTQDSASVTFSAAAHVKEDWIGRYLRVASTTTDYQIIDVDASANTAKLGRTYIDSTNGTATYTLTDLRSATDLDFSESQAPITGTTINDWPVVNNLGGVQSKTLYGATGVAVDARGNLTVFTLTGVWRVSGNPGSFAIQNIGEGMGCFSGQSIQIAGGLLYWLGHDGVWVWPGEGDPVCLSKPDGDESAGIQGTIDAINGDEATIICSNYNQSTHKIRWWIPVDGSVSNNRCLRLDLQSKQFALQTASDVTCAATIPGPSGLQVTLVGDVYGHVWQIDCGYIDGAYGFEPKQTYSSYTAATRTFAVTGTALPTSGDALSGVPAAIIRPSTGAYEMVKVESNTSSAAVFTEPLAVLTPASGDLIVFGAIPLDCVSGEIHDNHPEIAKWIEAMTLGHEVESAATEVFVGACADNDDPSIYPAGDYCAMTETDGEHHFWLRTPRGRSVQFRILAFARGYRVRLRGYALSIRSQAPQEIEG